VWTFLLDEEVTSFLIARFHPLLPAGATVTGFAYSFEAGFEFVSTYNAGEQDEAFINAGGESSGDIVALLGALPISNGSLEVQGHGGQAFLPGTLGTADWDDVNANDASVLLTWRITNLTTGSQPFDVDWVGLEVFYVTAPRTPAKLQGSISQGGVTSCDTAWDIIDEYGTGFGLIATNEWELRGFRADYQRSTTRPTCPTCGCSAAVPCALCDPSPASALAFTFTFPNEPGIFCSDLVGTHTVVVEFQGGDFTGCYYGYDPSCDDA
jgi:hypothetical protein